MSDEMILDADRARAAEAGLRICGRCGWYDDNFSSHHCDSAQGRIAIALALAVPEITAHKLGYGNGYLTFEIDEHTHVRFRINFDHTIQLEEIYALQDLTITDAADLVRAVKKALNK